MSLTSPERVADVQEMLWRLEAKYGPVLAEPIDQVAVAHQVAELELPTPAAVRHAFELAGLPRPPLAYAAELNAMLARRLTRTTLLDLIVEFRQYAIGALSRRFGGNTKGHELELRDFLRTYLRPRGYTEAEAGRGDTDLVIASIPAIIETKVWYSIAEYESALTQLDRYIHTERPKEAYMVMFGDRDPLPSIVTDHEHAIVEPRPVLSGLIVPVVVVPFEVDYPSKLKEARGKRAQSGR